MAPDEYAYLLDLHLFLGKELSVVTPSNPEGIVGRMPQSLIEEQHSTLLTLHENHVDLVSNSSYKPVSQLKCNLLC